MLLTGVTAALSLLGGVLAVVESVTEDTSDPTPPVTELLFAAGLYALALFAITLLSLTAALLVALNSDRVFDWCSRHIGHRAGAFRDRLRASYDLRTDLLRAPLAPGSVTWRAGVIDRFERRVSRMQNLRERQPSAALKRLERRAEHHRSRLEAYVRGERIRRDVVSNLRRSASPNALAAGDDLVFFAHRAVVGDSFLRAAIIAHEITREADTSWLEGWRPHPRLLLAPAWVHAALLETAPTIEMMDSGDNVRRSFGEPVAAAGLEPLDVLSLWDPYGDGPFRDLPAVVEALRML